MFTKIIQKLEQTVMNSGLATPQSQIEVNPQIKEKQANKPFVTWEAVSHVLGAL